MPCGEVKWGLLKHVLDNTTGIKNMVLSGYNVVPKAVIMFGNNSPIEAQSQNLPRSFFSFTDGTDERVHSIMMRNGVGTTGTQSRGATNETIMFLGNTGAINGEGNVVGVKTGGVEVDMTNAAGQTGWPVNCIFLGGPGIDAVKLGTIADGTFVDTVTSVTGVGFKPDMLIVIGNGPGGFGDSAAGNMVRSIGFADNGDYMDGEIHQASMQWHSLNLAATSDVRHRPNNTYMEQWVNPTGDLTALQLDSFDDDGFTFTTKVSLGGAYQKAYMAIKFGPNIPHWIGHRITPGAAGAESIVEPAMEPVGVLNITSNNQGALDVTETANDADCYGFSAFNDVDPDRAMADSDEDGAGTTVTRRRQDAKSYMVMNGAGTVSEQSTLTSMDTLGWTWDFDVARSGGTRYLSMVIGKENSGTKFNRRVMAMT